MAKPVNEQPAPEDDHCGSRKSRTVLVVDDDAAVARLIAHMAEHCGFAATIALSAGSFRSRYDVAQPDAVLVDLSIPGGDGVELLKFLAERHSNTLVLIVSGCDPRVLEAAMRLGLALGLRMGEPLMKPVRVSDLEAALRSVSSPEGGVRHELCV